MLLYTFLHFKRRFNNYYILVKYIKVYTYNTRLIYFLYKELRNYFISKSMFDWEWKSEKIEQIIGRLRRIDENTNNQPRLTSKNESVAIPTNNSTENNKK